MIKIYLHGRPQGQDLWSASPIGDDKHYLNPFLDSKVGEGMDSVMQIDVWQKNAYYSYIHRKNVVEKGTRPGSYFAITVCFEKQLCTQVSLLYNLLESVYKQLCVNNLIESGADQERFLVAQFKEKENVLSQISTVILQNINKYVVANLKPLNTDVDTTKSTQKLYANVDVDSPQFLSDCTGYRVLVAPSIVSKDKLPAELKQKISVIESEKDKLAIDRNNWQSKAEHESAENKQLLKDKDNLQQQIKELQKQVDTIKEEQRKVYEKQLKDLKEKSSKLETDLDAEKKLKQGLQNELNKSKQAQSNLEQELEKEKQKKKESKNDSSASTSVPATKQQAVPYLESISNMDIQNLLHNLTNEHRRMAGRFPLASKYITMGASVLSCVLLLAAIIFYFMGTPKIYSDADQVKTDTITIYKTAQLEKLPYSTTAKIDIMDFAGGDMLVNATYGLRLKDNSGLTGYKWVVEGSARLVGKDSLEVTGAGTIKISCVDSHNYIIVSRELKAKAQ